jgi:hypothetical protein
LLLLDIITFCLCFGLPWPSSESQHQWLTQLPIFGKQAPPGKGTNGVVRKPRKANLVQRNSLPSKSLVLYLTRYIQRTLPMSSHT